jgi:hypothetical protein
MIHLAVEWVGGKRNGRRGLLCEVSEIRKQTTHLLHLVTCPACQYRIQKPPSPFKALGDYNIQAPSGASATITYQCMPADQDEVLFRLASHFPHPMFPFMVCTHAEAIGFGAVRADFEEPSYESA